MTGRIGRHLAAAAILAVLGLLAFAWYDGGVREMRPVSETVILPEIAR